MGFDSSAITVAEATSGRRFTYSRLVARLVMLAPSCFTFRAAQEKELQQWLVATRKKLVQLQEAGLPCHWQASQALALV